MTFDFAKQLLQSEFSEERGRFLSSILQSAREGHLCFQSNISSPLPPLSCIIQDEDRYYIQKNWIYETHLLKHVKRLREQPVSPAYNAAGFAQELRQETGLSAEQKQVVQHLFDQSFAVICGGPGTGKTYTAGCFIRLLSKAVDPKWGRSLRVAFTAPTGKAALHLHSSVQLEDQIDYEAATLHRLLQLRPGETALFSPRRLDFDVIVVDEASMIDVALLCHLLGAVGNQTKLIFMGDPNQLPPVEGGGIFHEWASLFGKMLTHCMRTQEPKLQESAGAILEGNRDRFFASVDWTEGLDADWVDSLYKQIRPVFSSEKIDPSEVLERALQFRVLNALRQGPFGVEALNQEILRRMEIQCPDGWWWAVPILSTANQPHLNLSNGSFGVLIGQKKKRFELAQGVAYFQELLGKPLTHLPPYELSFLLSIHKSQGSEFKEVLAIFPEGSESFGKEVLYTAATRAKKQWKVVGKQEVIESLISKTTVRHSGFSLRFRKGFQNFCV